MKITCSYLGFAVFNYIKMLYKKKKSALLLSDFKNFISLLVSGIKKKKESICFFFIPADKDALSKIPSDLLLLGESLERTVKNSEPKFLKLGEELQLLYTDAKQLAELTMKSAKSVGGETDQSLLNSISRLARQSLTNLRQRQAEISESLKQVDAVANHLENLCEICPVIEKTGMSLNVVGLNIAVESSRSPESREMFAVFVHEIRNLSKNVFDISLSIFNDSKATHSSQITAHTGILAGQAELGKLQDAARKTVQNTVTEIRHMMGLSLKSLEKTGELSDNISRQIGEIVVAIQFHDITRQQVEHIVSAINDAEYLCKETADTADDLKSRSWGCAYRVLKLQAAQLEQVISEIETAYQKSIHAFENLGDQIEYLVKDVSSLNGSEKKDEISTEMRIKVLKSGLNELHKLLDQGYDLKNHLRETAEQVSETTSRLSRHISMVRHISMELHLKALNAVIKSARLTDKGSTFEILAQEVNTLSKESDRFAADVVKILESVISLAQELKKESQKEQGSPSDNADFSFERGITEITMVYEQFKSDSLTVLQKSQDLQGAILKTKSELSFLSDLENEFRDYITQIKKMIKILEPFVKKDEKDNSEDKIDQLAKRYTMKRERELHHKYVYPSDVKEQPSVQTAEAESLPELPYPKKEKKDDDDLGDNVELF